MVDTGATRLNGLFSKLQSDFGHDRVSASDNVAAAVKTADGIVKATPIGMAKLPGLPLPAGVIEQRHWVADIVNFPLETELLREVKQRGCQTMNGSGMAIHQAAGAYEIFTGLRADRSRMQKSFVDFVGGPAAGLD